MIYGVGTDIVSVKRMEEALTRHGERFLARVLSDQERGEMPEGLDLARGLARFLAKRWAAKEAFGKAFGTGIGATVSFHDVTISHDEKGKPLIVISEALQAAMLAAGAGGAHISISDEVEYAVAFVVIDALG
jgi:holo-[acyl-carrier protein] synthase